MNMGAFSKKNHLARFGYPMTKNKMSELPHSSEKFSKMCL